MDKPIFPYPFTPGAPASPITGGGYGIAVSHKEYATQGHVHVLVAPGCVDGQQLYWDADSEMYNTNAVGVAMGWTFCGMSDDVMGVAAR